MADSVWVPASTSAGRATTALPRHNALVRVTHWLTTICFLALLVSGAEIVMSHPRFYWGETGNVLTTPLFQLPFPSSRDTVPTGYGYVLPDQNGWSRYLHFQSAWLVVFTGLLYVLFGLLNGHFRRNFLPARGEFSWRALRDVLGNHLRFRPASESGVWSYNLLQRLTYLIVVFILFPLVIWTGLAMSPAIASVSPPVVTLLGGQQSARTIHFFVSIFLFLFLVAHVMMICRNGFRDRMRAMITGHPVTERHRP